MSAPDTFAAGFEVPLHRSLTEPILLGGAPADVARHHRHRTELAQCARTAQQHAVQQCPADVRQRDVPERLPAAGPQAERSQFFVRALLLHQRHQFARDEGKRHEDGRQHDARQREHDFGKLHVQLAQQR